MREVWRLAYALLHDAFDGVPPTEELELFRAIPEEKMRVVEQQAEKTRTTTGYSWKPDLKCWKRRETWRKQSLP